MLFLTPFKFAGGSTIQKGKMELFSDPTPVLILIALVAAAIVILRWIRKG
jgi:hypothetical protein